MIEAANDNWGLPDENGVCARYGTKARESRVRRAFGVRPDVDTLLGETRELVIALLRRDATSALAKTVFSLAGNSRHVAIDAVAYLLTHGWIETAERRHRSDWELTKFRWLEPDALRAALLLETRADRLSRRNDLLSRAPTNEALRGLHDSLASLPDATLARRAVITAGLDRWTLDQRSGTRVNFALFATGDTKAVTASDWTWLERHIGLEELGISQHTPALALRGPICLTFQGGTLDLRVVPDMISLSPETIASVISGHGIHEGWLLIENRTSFEDVARRMGHRFITVWMPGFVPDWWLTALNHLVSAIGGSAFIAADPDPAGIEIALRASTPWKQHWVPWAMSADDLADVGEGKRLSDDDLKRLARLETFGLPEPLAELASALRSSGRKGEQESLDLVARLVKN